ncbi:hypothetical protein C8J42_103589 [Sphingomonas sp. PP-CE-1A-559]|nr:hypothetical protein C8J42_103589 [Sphingomonas sp. PP-CE-1A-559]
MHAMMIVIALSAAGSITWRLLKERKRSRRRLAIRQRHDADALRNRELAQQREAKLAADSARR